MKTEKHSKVKSIGWWGYLLRHPLRLYDRVVYGKIVSGECYAVGCDNAVKKRKNEPRLCHDCYFDTISPREPGGRVKRNKVLLKRKYSIKTDRDRSGKPRKLIVSIGRMRIKYYFDTKRGYIDGDTRWYGSFSINLARSEQKPRA